MIRLKDKMVIHSDMADWSIFEIWLLECQRDIGMLSPYFALAILLTIAMVIPIASVIMARNLSNKYKRDCARFNYTVYGQASLRFYTSRMKEVLT